MGNSSMRLRSLVVETLPDFYIQYFFEIAKGGTTIIGSYLLSLSVYKLFFLSCFIHSI